MKNVLPYLLVFITLNAAAQFNEALKVEPVFLAQQYTLTVNSPEGKQTYEFEKRQTSHSKTWFVKSNKHRHKIIWDNYQKLEGQLKQNAYNYYSMFPKYPIANSVSYTLSSPNQSISFEAAYINIPKILHHVGWMQNPGALGGHP